MIRKIKFYRALLLEIIETLCSICLYLDREGHLSHNPYTTNMYDHFKTLKQFSEKMREVN